jgi:hypothetical protein
MTPSGNYSVIHGWMPVTLAMLLFTNGWWGAHCNQATSKTLDYKTHAAFESGPWRAISTKVCMVADDQARRR